MNATQTHSPTPDERISSQVPGRHLNGGADEEISRLKAELERTRQELAELRGFVENTSIGLHWVRSDGIIQWANRADYEPLGYTAEEYIGHHISEFHADQEVISDILTRLTRGEKIRNYEARLKCKDGGNRFGLIDSCVRWEEGKFVHTQCFTRDITERKSAEDRLRESEAFNRAIIESSKDCLKIIDLDGRIVYINPGGCDVLECEDAKILSGRYWPEFWQGDTRTACLAAIEHAKAGRSGRFEGFCPSFKGTPKWWDVCITPIRGPDQKMDKLLALSRDITARTEAESALQSQREHLKAIIENTPECIKIVAADGTLLQMNAAGLCMIEAASPAEALGKNVYDVIAPEHRSAFKEMNERVCRGSKELLEFEIIGLQGTRRLMQTHAAPIADPQTGELLHLAITRDITAEVQAKESAAHLAAIVTYTDDAIFSTDLEGVIRSWNRGAERLYGYSSDEALGHPVQMLVPHGRQEEYRDLLGRVRRGEATGNYETVRRRKDGTLIHVALTVSPVMNSAGLIVGVSKVARDITEKIHAREQLERTVELRTAQLRDTVDELEAFSYSIAHDMRAPLRAMNSYARILETDYKQALPDEARDFLQRISSSATRLDALIIDVLNYSKIARDEMSLEKVDLEKLTREIVQSYPNFSSSGATIMIQSGIPPVIGNVGALTQTISNLLSNAIKFVAPGTAPQVRVYAEKKEKSVRIWFEDNGIGISEEGQKRIFRMFQRLNASKEFEGTGIGLTIVRKAVQRMGGAVGVESEAGRGSRFWIELKPA
ncbi:MAG TPA: PAS domain S-box protein [Methylomirabilota bacterium]|nr:PAS domain S-box protein [Methylomirabilota bacterium]